ncbi:MAG: enoyl-CoA hydratase/isomerase family protein [Burkholderiaceae bacterium]
MSTTQSPPAVQRVQLSRPEPHLAQVTLMGDGRFNLMSYAMLRELWTTANRIQEDREIRVVMVSGTQGVFSAGMNLKQPEVSQFEQYTVEERLDIHSLGARACAAWEGLDAVTIAAIEGPCMGGGVAFAVACDFRVAASDAKLWVPELKHGMNMSWQSVPRIVSLVGPARARKLVMLAAQIDPATAAEWGLVDEVAAPGQALARSLEMARTLLSIPPAPLRMSKHAIGVAANALNHAVSYMDLEQYAVCQSTDAHREALSAFMQRKG